MKHSGKITVSIIAKLVLAGFGLLLMATAAVSSFLFSIFSAITLGPESPAAFSLMALFWNAGLLSLLVLPMLVNVILALLGKEPLSWPGQPGIKPAAFVLLLWPLLFWLGTLLAKQATLAWALLPPLQTLLVLLPLGFMMVLGLGLMKLPVKHTQWSVLGVSLLVTPTVIIFVEIIVFGLALVGFMVWAVTRPELLAELEQLSLRLMNAPIDDPEVLERIMMPYFQQPGVITGALVMVSGVIPFLEEIFKPMAVWFLIPRKLSPREGFAMGMISGAAFALIESLGNLVNPLGEMWSTVMLGRLGTGILHILTSALVGWGIALAWTQRKVLRLVLIYLGAVVLHAVWNVFALLMGFGPLVSPAAATGLSGLYAQIGTFAPFVLATLAVFMLYLLVSRSRNLGQDDDLAVPLTQAVPAED